MLYDPHKGLSMQYNFLNLPSEISQMRLIYDATGRKWFKYGEFGVTGYASGIEYHDGKLEAIYAPDDRMVAEYTGGAITLLVTTYRRTRPKVQGFCPTKQSKTLSSTPLSKRVSKNTTLSPYPFFIKNQPPRSSLRGQV